MNITFEKNEFVVFIDSVQTWHRERFDFVLLNMFQNYDRHDFAMRATPAVEIKNQIKKWSDLFEKDHPFPNWRNLI